MPTRGPTVLDGGALHVPARYTPLLLDVLRETVRRGTPLPEVRELFEACGMAARESVAARLHPGAPATPTLLSMPQTGPPSEEEVDVSAAMDRLGVSAQRVRQLAKSGRLAGRQVGAARCWWFTRATLEDFRQAREQAGR